MRWLEIDTSIMWQTKVITLIDSFIMFRSRRNLRRLFIIFSLSYSAEYFSAYAILHCNNVSLQTSVEWFIYLIFLVTWPPGAQFFFNGCVCCLEIRVRPHVSVSVHSSNISKLVTIVEGDPNASFSIATKPREGRYTFPWIAPFCPWSIPYNAEC